MNEEYEEEMFEEMLEPEEVERLKVPKLVSKYMRRALEISNYNPIPAGINAFVLLGQAFKNYVAIPVGPSKVDLRVHFIWIQTSGTGKSQMWNFVRPVSESVFNTINAIESHEERSLDEYSIFVTKEYTAAALIGSSRPLTSAEQAMYDDDEDAPTSMEVKGELFGSGLASWDEFENSGVFKESGHKEGIINYLNTYMNDMWGQTYIMTKKLASGDLISCECQRSTYATTYIPENLTKIIVTKGVLQRMVIYIRDVPVEEQKKMNAKQISMIGKASDSQIVVDDISQEIVEVYKKLKKRYKQRGENPINTIQYDDSFSQAIQLKYNAMVALVETSPKKIRDLGLNFSTRLRVSLQKMATICCILESADDEITDKRWVATSKHVNQAFLLLRECYNGLLTWLESSIRMPKSVLQKEKTLTEFEKAYTQAEKELDGFVKKNTIREIYVSNGNSQAKFYTDWSKIKSNWLSRKEGKVVFVKPKGDEE